MAKACGWHKGAIAAATACLLASPTYAANIPCPNIDVGGDLSKLTLAPYWEGSERKTFTDLRKGDQLAELGQVYGLFIGSYPSKLDVYFQAIGEKSHAFLAIASHNGKVRGVQCNILVAP